MERKSGTVLVVEDDPGIRMLLVAVLSRTGLEVETAGNGESALEAIRRRSYDLIVLDLLMRGVSGYDFLQQAERASPAIGSRIIVVTAASSAELARHSLDTQVFKVLRKPFDLEDLLATVSSCLSGSGRAKPMDGGFLALRAASEAANAKSAIVGVLDSSGAQVQLLWSFGYADDVVNVYYPLPVVPNTPIGTSITERRAVWIGSREEAARLYPSLLSTLDKHGTHALAATPIMAGNDVAGTMGWTFSTPQAFDEQQRRALLRIADQYSHVISA
jgi:DNA-binding response OmpR family regulator